MFWKGSGRRDFGLSEVLTRNLHEVTEDNHKHPLSVQKFDPEIEADVSPLPRHLVSCRYKPIALQT
jgi:hypothetical protein